MTIPIMANFFLHSGVCGGRNFLTYVYWRTTVKIREDIACVLRNTLLFVSRYRMVPRFYTSRRREREDRENDACFAAIE